MEICSSLIGTAMLLPPSDLRTVPILIEPHSLWFDTGLIATIAQISKENQMYAPFKTDVQEISRQTNCVPSAVSPMGLGTIDQRCAMIVDELRKPSD
jgi:hypothetical protein